MAIESPCIIFCLKLLLVCLFRTETSWSCPYLQVPDSTSFSRHMCSNGCTAWEGHPGHSSQWAPISQDACEVCGSPWFIHSSCGMQPSRTFYLFSPSIGVRDLFLDKEFCDLVKKDNDVSMHSYRSSSDFKRIDRGGVGWPPRLISRENTILIGLTADGCHMHTNAVRTGNSVFFLCC